MNLHRTAQTAEPAKHSGRADLPNDHDGAEHVRWPKPVWILAILLAALTLPAKSASLSDQPLTTLTYRIVGSQMKVSPTALSVPKGVAGSVMTEIPGLDLQAGGLADGSYVEGVLRGPAFEARRVVGQVNAALLLPPLNLVGDYQLDNLRLVDAATGATRLEASPSSIPIRVFDEVLVSRVTSRPLTSAEIQEKGIVIDERNFRAVEFEVGFVVDGQSVPVRFPVVAPAFRGATEIIPQAELEARLAQADQANREIAANIELPEALQAANWNFEIQAVEFQRVEGAEIDLTLRIPPIPALMVIPGNIGYLNQFFSVQVFTENAAPGDSGLSVRNVTAQLILPPGPDRLPAASYDEPGDDPLRFARVGPAAVIQDTRPIAQPGADGALGTADDLGRLLPGEGGQGEFLVEGLQEGLHVMDLVLTADLDGLAAGPVKIQGKAAGSVLVRNPKFSMAFSHPRTIRAGEPYEAFVTVLNTSSSPANEVSVNLRGTSLSGGALESAENVNLGTILPGETATAKFRVRALRTGSISFSNLTTGDDSVSGRFRLSMSVDERGVALSPDTIALPDYVRELPPALVDAAQRVLGQALSVATAPQLPPTVIPIRRTLIQRRGLDLAEAGQRIQYGEAAQGVLVDLLLDWQGGREFDRGFDQILRETDAGREFRVALMQAIEAGDAVTGAARLQGMASRLAARGESWVLGSLEAPAVEQGWGEDADHLVFGTGPLPGIQSYPGARGSWLVELVTTNGAVLAWKVTEATAAARLRVVQLGTNGTARDLEFGLSDLAAGARCVFAGGDTLRVDADGDGSFESSVTAQPSIITEDLPQVLAVLQDETVWSGRPKPSCLAMSGMENYGTILAVLFSKPMRADEVSQPGAYQLDNGNTANSVQIQPGGRVALLNMARPVGAIRPRTLTVHDVTDPRGLPVQVAPIPIQRPAAHGVALRGRVARADRTPAAGIPVTLTMYDQLYDEMMDSCLAFNVRVSQVTTDAEGAFEFDFVPSGIPYSVSATDTAGLSDDASKLIMEATAETQLVREKLLELANSPSVRNTLLGVFAVGALPEAIAAAEGLDRAVWRDQVEPGSAREGAVVPVALRFRGRGTVIGQVLAPDGLTPMAQVAVNLFPDPDSRELGRGLLSDDDGRFAFFGVPLGSYTLEAKATSGAARTVSGALSQPGEVAEVPVILSEFVLARAQMRGRVTEADHTTPHPRATVYVGTKTELGFGNIVAMSTSGADGYWSVPDLPAGTYAVVAVSLDGKRKGERLDIATAAGSSPTVNIPLQGRARVLGRVERSNGQPVANALVGGGEAIVRTDAQGNFVQTGVPTGPSYLPVGVERDPANGFDFPRIGGATVQVVAGIDNFVVIRLEARGRVVGRVLDVEGRPVPGAKVAMPIGDGFIWVRSDSSGTYRFEDLGLGSNIFSAAEFPTAVTDMSGILETLKTSSSEAEIEAAINEAFATFTGANDPYLNGEGASFSPSSWGYTSATLSFDGQTVVADIRSLRTGSVSGRVLNHQGVPIGARVRLTGLGPNPAGVPTTVLRGERNTDPAVGTFEFPNHLFVGPWQLQVASPFYPTVLTTNGVLTSVDLEVTNVVLMFPPVKEVNGRLAGTVLLPNGAPAGEGVAVHIDFSDDYVIRTDDTGFFDTQIALPAFTAGVGGQLGGARTYLVEANDPVTGGRGQSLLTMVPGITNLVTVRLLDRGALRVRVLQANGQPAVGAALEINQGAFPHEHFQGASDGEGWAQFNNLFQGPYSVAARWESGLVRLSGRAGASIAPQTLTSTVVTLTPTATLRGVFLSADGVTPMAFAQIAIGDLGFTTTDAQGAFEVVGVPLGTYVLLSEDPVSGAGARQVVTLNLVDGVFEVRLAPQPRGDITGLVIDGYGANPVPGATVQWNGRDGIAVRRTVTTGPDGTFGFSGVPLGDFDLEATHPRFAWSVTRSGTLSVAGATLTVRLQLPALNRVTITVQEPGGQAPATNATVQLESFDGRTRLAADVGLDGTAVFPDLTDGPYVVHARSLDPATSRSIGGTELNLRASQGPVEAAISLAGVSSLRGQVRLSDGVTPAPGAVVMLLLRPRGFADEREFAVTDDAGLFQFANLPVLSPYRVEAEANGLAASVEATPTGVGSEDQVLLVLTPSGTVRGRLVRADGITPVVGEDVILTLAGGRKLGERTDGAGGFRFDSVPLGGLGLEAASVAVAGLARRSAELTANGQDLDLGDVRLDEDDPHVTASTPEATASGVSIHTTIELLFNEALDPATLSPAGVFLRSPTGPVVASVELVIEPGSGERRLVRLTPAQPLVSEVTYQVVVIDGERLDQAGSVVGSGPRDLVGRPLTVPFLASFTTADFVPPRLVSISPEHQAIQVDPRAVVRLSFNEPVRDAGYTLTLTGPGGPVVGTAVGALNGLVLAFTPAAALDVNATYTLSVSGVKDLAGNDAEGQPFVTTFKTLDTLGPSVELLRLAQGRRPVAGARLQVEAMLAAPEPGARVRFTQDFQPLGTADAEPYRVPVSLPTSGQTTLRAIAIDTFGNEGPVAELPLTVVPNEPPHLVLERASPAAGPVASGASFSITVSAEDDVEVTNILITVSGAANSSTNLPSGAPVTLGFLVPASAQAGAQIEVRARAADALGLASTEAVLTVAVSDGTLPSLTLLSPAADALLHVEAPLILETVSADNSTRLVLEAVLSGGLAATQRLDLVTVPNQPSTNQLTFSLAAAPRSGVTLTALVRATDEAGHATELSRTYRLPDSQPPRLVGLTPTNGAVRVDLWTPRLTLAFDEPIAPAWVVAENLVLFDELGVQVDRGVRVDPADPRLIHLEPVTLPLQPGVTYSNHVAAVLADAAGNGWIDLAGQPVPAEGAGFTFTTAAILGAQPPAHSPVVPGQGLNVSLDFEPGLGADRIRFILHGQATNEIAVHLATTRAAVAWTLPTNAPSAVISIAALRSDQDPLLLPEVTLDVRPRTGDDDSDGWANGFEADRGMNPFLADADSADLDQDGLTNGQEKALGTDPARSDSDTDGLNDQEETVLGTNPLLADTDGDGRPDGTDPRPLVASRPPAWDLLGEIELVQGVELRVAVRATDADEDVKGLRVVAVPGDWARCAWPNGTDTQVAQVVGGFDGTRGGKASLRDGELTRDLRVAISNAFPLATFTAAFELTRGYLASNNVVVLASVADVNQAVTPLTVAEQTELRSFAERGGSAVVLADNDVFAGMPTSDQANDSLLTPFGFGVTGTAASPTSPPVSVPAPSLSPVTDGPFGKISTFNTFYPGWFNQVPAAGTVLGRLNTSTNQEPVLAVLSPGALAVGSGWVTLASDTTLPGALYLNALAAAGFTQRMPELRSDLILRRALAGTSQFDLVAFDLDGNSVTQTVTVVTLADLDGDTIPDRDDPDIDGDALANSSDPDPRDPDVDDDGLLDGVDPDPLVPAGIAFTVPAAVTIAEGGCTNIPVRVDYPGAPLAWVHFATGSAPPTFASLGAWGFTNTNPGGVCTNLLSLCPALDAAGTYILTLEATAQNGVTARTNISVTVTGNPMLMYNAWTSANSGPYDSFGQWSMGIFPIAGTTPVVAARGAPYTISVPVGGGTEAIILDSPEATILATGALTRAVLSEIRQGTVSIANFAILQIRQPTVNAGLIQLDGETYFRMFSGMRLENRGTLAAVDQATPAGTAASCEVPVTCAPDGTVTVGNNAWLNFQRGLALAGGSVVVDGTGRVTLPGNDLLLMAGSRLTGAGQLRLSGSSRLVVQGDATLAASLTLSGSSTVHGSATLIVQSQGHLLVDHSLPCQGAIDVAGTLSLTEPTALLTVDGTLTLQPAGTLTNLGTIRAGRFVNLGGTIVGNLPAELTGGVITELTIAAIRLVRNEPEGGATEVVLVCTAPPGRKLAVLSSADLKNWKPSRAGIVELWPGRYESRVSLDPSSQMFFRVQWLSPGKD